MKKRGYKVIEIEITEPTGDKKKLYGLCQVEYKRADSTKPFNRTNPIVGWFENRGDLKRCFSQLYKAMKEGLHEPIKDFIK